MDQLDDLAGLLHEVNPQLRLVAGLRDLAELDALDDYQDSVVATVERLLAVAEVDVLAVTQAIAYVNDALTRRLLALAEKELGPPPCAYAWLSLGSHGRGEQVLSSDQDSALAYAADGGEAAAAYFPLLATLVVEALARAGLPLCAGGYMATHWCRAVDDFRDMFRGWVDRPEPGALVQAEVFLDVRRVHGELSVDVLDRLLLIGGSRGPFRAQMARAAVAFRPPLGPLGRLRRGPALDVKLGGIAAIVLLARLYALTAGSPARTTLSRLRAAADGGTLHERDAAELGEAYRFLTGLRLRTQVAQVRDGREPDNLVPLADLDPPARDRLRRVLRQLQNVQEATRSRFSTYAVT